MKQPLHGKNVRGLLFAFSPPDKSLFRGLEQEKTTEKNRVFFINLCLIFPGTDLIMKVRSGEKWSKVHQLPTKMARQTDISEKTQEVKSFDR